jgi:hypothetical protein
MGELDEVRNLRLKLKAARALIRDLAVACAQCEDALDRARYANAQPKEAQREHEHPDGRGASERRYAAA